MIRDPLNIDWFAVGTFPWLAPLVAGYVLWRLTRFVENRVPASEIVPSPPLVRAGDSSSNRTLVAILAAALLIRLYRLGSESMDLLEYTYYFMGANNRDLLTLLLHEISLQQAHQPIYHLLLSAMTWTGSVDMTWLRLPSAALGVLAIWVCHRLIRRIIPGAPRAADLTALGLAIHPLAVWYGRDLTPYTLFGAVAACSYLFLWDALHQRRGWLPYVLMCTIGFYTHYYGIWLVFSHILIVAGWTLLVRPQPWTMALAAVRAWILWFVTIIPWLPFFIRGLELGYASLNITGPVYSDTLTFTDALYEGFRQFVGVTSGPWVPGILLAGAAAYFAGIRQLWKHNRPAFAFLFLPAVSAVITEAIFYWKLHSLTEGYYLQIRHYIYALPPVVATCVVGLGSDLGRGSDDKSPMRWRRILTVGTGVVLLTCNAAFSGHLLAAAQKAPVPKIVRDIHASLEDGDAIAVLPASFYSHLFAYYFAPSDNRESDLFGEPGWKRVSGPMGEPVMTYLPVTDFRVPFRYAIDNLHFRRLWVVNFDEQVLGLAKFTSTPYDSLLGVVRASGHKILETRVYPHAEVTLVDIEHQTHPDWVDGRFIADLAEAETELAGFRRRRVGADGRHRYEWRIPTDRVDSHFDLRFRITWNSEQFSPPEPVHIAVEVEGREIERFTFQEEDLVRWIRIRRELVWGDEIDLAFVSDQRLWDKVPPRSVAKGAGMDWFTLEERR